MFTTSRYAKTKILKIGRNKTFENCVSKTEGRFAFWHYDECVDRKEHDMTKHTPILLSVIVLLVASLACVVPNVSVPATPDQNLMSTAVAQTVAAALAQTQVSPSLVPIGVVTDTPSLTFTPEPPTLTPTETLTLTPIFTSTPLIPQISVSVATNCRVGPGKIYDRVGALLVGEVAEVYGRNAAGNYWYIRNPDSSGGFCWLWA